MGAETALDEADDFLASMGLSAAPAPHYSSPPADPNEAFYQELTGGRYSKIDNMVYWMKSEMAIYLHILENHVNLTKNSMVDGRPAAKPISRMEYGRIVLRYYLDMQHLPRFQKINEKTPCDYATMIDKIVAYQPMQNVIENFEG